MKHAPHKASNIPILLEKYGDTLETLERVRVCLFWKYAAGGKGSLGAIEDDIVELALSTSQSSKVSESIAQEEQPKATKAKSKESETPKAVPTQAPQSEYYTDDEDEDSSDKQKVPNKEVQDSGHGENPTPPWRQECREMKNRWKDNSQKRIKLIEEVREKTGADIGDYPGKVPEYCDGYLDWLTGWKARSYDGYDIVHRRLRVKHQPRHTGVRITKWNWNHVKSCYIKTYDEAFGHRWEMIETLMPIETRNIFKSDNSVSACVCITQPKELRCFSRQMNEITLKKHRMRYSFPAQLYLHD